MPGRQPLFEGGVNQLFSLFTNIFAVVEQHISPWLFNNIASLKPAFFASNCF